MSTGITQTVYLGGLPIGRGPKTLSPDDEAAQTIDLYLNGSRAVDSLALPWPGAPAVIEKRAWNVSWEVLSEADIHYLNRLVSLRGVMQFYFVPWLYWTESFLVLPGAPRAGALARRTALSAISPPPEWAAAAYPTTAARGWEDLSAWADLSVTLGSAVNGHTPWTASGTSSAPEFVSIEYAPAYRVTVGSAQQTFAIPHIQGQTLRLLEM